MIMRKGLQDKAKRLAVGVGMGALLTIPVATVLSDSAGAAAPCYTGCSSPVTGLPVTSGDGGSAATTLTATAASSASTSSGLAFTGADLSGLVVISAGALGAGALMVRISRRRRAA
jgi:hypothetical protein